MKKKLVRLNEIEERFFNYFGTYAIHRKRVRELRFYGTPISKLLPQQVPEIIRAALNWGLGNSVQSLYQKVRIATYEWTDLGLV